MTGAGDGPDSAERGGSTAAAPGQVFGLARCCARHWLSSDSADTVSPVLFSDKVADMPVLVVQTVQTQFLDQSVAMPVGVQCQGNSAKTVEVPQSQLSPSSSSSWTRMLTCPFCARQVPTWVQTMQLSDKG